MKAVTNLSTEDGVAGARSSSAFSLVLCCVSVQGKRANWAANQVCDSQSGAVGRDWHTGLSPTQGGYLVLQDQLHCSA